MQLAGEAGPGEWWERGQSRVLRAAAGLAAPRLALEGRRWGRRWRGCRGGGAGERGALQEGGGGGGGGLGLGAGGGGVPVLVLEEEGLEGRVVDESLWRTEGRKKESVGTEAASTRRTKTKTSA